VIKLGIKRYIGIDLGTTNTVISVVSVNNQEYSEIRTIEIRQHKGIGKNATKWNNILPSKFYVDLNGNEYFGSDVIEDAKELQDGHLIENTKLSMGLSTITNKKEIHGKFYDHVTSASKIIEFAITQSKIGSLTKDDRVIITTPASFNTIQNEQTKKAALDAGIPEECLMNHMEEPVAALFDYIRTEIDAGHAIKECVLVVDIGGGTTDIVLIDLDIDTLGSGHYDLISKSRYEELGGIQFDYLIAKGAIKKALSITDDDDLEYELDGKQEEIIQAHLLTASYVKQQLIEQMNSINNSDLIDYFEINNELFSGDIKEDVEISYQEICEFTKELWSYDVYTTMDSYTRKKNIFYHIFDTINHLFSNYQGSVQTDEITLLYLVGGMTSFPIIGEEIQKVFKNIQIVSGNRMEAISKGACYYASRLDNGTFNIETKNLNLLSDSYLLDISNGLPVTIAKKGEKLPYEEVKDGFVLSKAAEEMLLTVLFGEDELDPNLKFESARSIKTYSSLIKDQIAFHIKLTNDNFDLQVEYENKKQEHLDYKIDREDIQSRINVFSQTNFSKDLMKEFQAGLKDFYNTRQFGTLNVLIDQTRMDFPELPFVEMILYLSLAYNGLPEVQYNSFKDQLTYELTRVVDTEYTKDKSYFTKSIKHVLQYWKPWKAQISLLVDLVKRLNKEKFNEAHTTLCDFLVTCKYLKSTQVYFEHLVQENEYDFLIDHILANPIYRDHFEHDNLLKIKINQTFKEIKTSSQLEQIRNQILSKGLDYDSSFATNPYYELVSAGLNNVLNKIDSYDDLPSFIYQFKQNKNERHNLSYHGLSKVLIQSMEDVEDVFHLITFIDQENDRQNNDLIAKMMANLFKNTSFQRFMRAEAYSVKVEKQCISMVQHLSFYAHCGLDFRDLILSFIRGTFHPHREEDALKFINVYESIAFSLKFNEEIFMKRLIKDYSYNPFIQVIHKKFLERIPNDPITELTAIINYVDNNQVFFTGLVEPIFTLIKEDYMNHPRLVTIIELLFDILSKFEGGNQKVKEGVSKLIIEVDRLLKVASITPEGTLKYKRQSVVNAFNNDTVKPEYVGK
jgi:molecular chaperone DnaK